MATKSSTKGRKATSTARKGATKQAAPKGMKKAAPKGAKTSAKAVKRGPTKATKAAKATKAKPAKGKASKIAGAGRAKRASSLTTTSTPISNIQIVPIDGADAEDKIACRTLSPLNLFPDIIAGMNTDNDPVDGRLRLTLKLSSIHAILLEGVFGCNPDALIYLPALSTNIAAIGGPEYLGPTPFRKIRVKIFSPNPQQVLPFTFAFRLRFTQNVGTPDLPIPRRKRGSVKVR